MNLKPPKVRPLRPFDAADGVDAWNSKLGTASAQETIRWAVGQFGDGLVLSSSFGAQSAVMLHLVTRVKPDIPVIFIDTGYLFPETYRFADKLARELNLNLHVFSAGMTAARQEALYGKRWEKGTSGVESYLAQNKVAPMQRALRELNATAWLAGLRAEQTEHRSNLGRVVSQDGRYKVHPILDWTGDETLAYLSEHGLPLHPLYEDGYRSIGDTHSTLPTLPGQDPREGRILGRKKECGLHVSLSDGENDSLKSSGL